MGFIDIRLNKFSLPKVIYNDMDYYIELDKYLQRYIEYIENINGLSDECIDNIKYNSDLILKSLQRYNNAQVGDAKDCIKKIVKKYCNEPYIVATIDENYAFRGMAPEKIQPKQYKNDEKYIEIYSEMNQQPLSFFKGRVSVEQIDRKDMLHIPFNKRGLITTQRFSIAGVPCLYLSTTSLGCWLELNMPQFDLLQVSSYKIPNDLKILNMCISQHTINGSINGCYVDDKEYKSTCSLLELFPLVCATSFQILERNRNFKSEYIISQLLMQAANELDIDGIAYLSKKIEDIYAYPQLVNLAILMKSNHIPSDTDTELNRYWEDSNRIELTDAFRLSKISSQFKQDTFKSYVNKIYKDDNFNNTLIITGKRQLYTDTVFSQFDEFLVRQSHYKFK